MNKDIKERWVKALRSGEYSQCRGMLYNGAEFCCLGVLTDLYLKETNQKWDVNVNAEPLMASKYSFENDSKLLSQSIREWSGIANDSPEIRVTGSLAQNSWLTNLNDDGVSFEQIASYIENDPGL